MLCLRTTECIIECVCVWGGGGGGAWGVGRWEGGAEDESTDNKIALFSFEDKHRT